MNMSFSTDYFNNLETPKMMLCNPNNKPVIIKDEDNNNVVCYIDNIEDFSLSPTFNAVSELSFRVYKSIGNNELLCFSKIENKRRLHINGFGYFIINNVSYNDDEKDFIYKDVSAVSVEYELNNKKLNYYKGTFKFYDSLNPQETLLYYLVSLLPNWNIGNVDSSVASKYRTFDISDSTVYGFLMSDVEDAYECIIDYDIENFTINVYDKNNYINNTSVYLTKAETNKSIKIEQVSEQVITALSIFGQNDLDISMINVIGENVIYNFDYYKNTDWMSQTLINAINAWENKIQTYQATYDDKLLSLLNQNATLQTKKSELSQLQSDLKYLNVQKSAIISDNKQNDLTSINSLISQKTTQINTKKAEVTTVQNAVTTLQNDIIAINNICAIKNNFSEVLYNELFPYIIESTYKDEYITLTDSMTFAQRQNQAKELYNKGVNILNKLSQPTYNISLQTNNFLFNSDYKDYLSQIQTGVLINIEVSDDNFQQFVLLKIPINFSAKECSFEFSNRFRLSDPSSVYNDLYKSVSSSANTVNFEKSIWGEAVKSGKLDDVVNFTKAPLDLTNNAIKSSNGQSMVIDDTGLNGLATLEDGSISPEQLKIVNNALAFTNDNFETLKTAIGKIYLPDGQLIDGKNYVYGICADYISGNLIAGNGLIIKTADGKFVVDDNGFHSEQVDNIENSMVTVGQVDTKIESAITQSDGEIKLYVDEKTALKSATYTAPPSTHLLNDTLCPDKNYIATNGTVYEKGKNYIATSGNSTPTYKNLVFSDGKTLKFSDGKYLVFADMNVSKWDKRDKYQTDTDVSASLDVKSEAIRMDFQNGGLSSKVQFDFGGIHCLGNGIEVKDNSGNKVFGVDTNGNLGMRGYLGDMVSTVTSKTGRFNAKNWNGETIVVDGLGLYSNGVLFGGIYNLNGYILFQSEGASCTVTCDSGGLTFANEGMHFKAENYGHFYNGMDGIEMVSEIYNSGLIIDGLMGNVRLYLNNVDVLRATSTNLYTNCTNAYFKNLYTFTTKVTSDRELKKDIKQNTEYALDKLKNVNFYGYTINNPIKDKDGNETGEFDNSYSTKIGLMHDECPEDIATTEENGEKHIDLYASISIAIKAIQELNKKVDRQAVRISDLESENLELRKLLEREKLERKIITKNIKKGLI